MALIINLELVNYNLQEVDTVHNIQCTYMYEEAHYIMCASIMVMTHLSFFVELLLPSFGQVSLHISKLVEGSHQVTTVLISGKELHVKCWFLVSGQLCVYSLFKEAIVRSDSLHQFHERSVSKELFTSVLEKCKEYVNAYYLHITCKHNSYYMQYLFWLQKHQTKAYKSRAHNFA